MTAPTPASAGPGRAAPAFAAFTCAALLATGAGARDLTDVERIALAPQARAYEFPINARDCDRVVALLPPRMLEVAGREGGMSADQLRGVMANMMGVRTLGITLEDMVVDGASPDVYELADGSPYALVTTMARYAREGLGRVQVTNSALAVLDGGEWYFLPLDNFRSLLLLQTAYPEFVGVEFPLGTATTAGQP